MGKLSEYRRSRDLAHILPFATFMAFQILLGLLQSAGFTFDRSDMPWYRAAPEQWVYPLQTVATLAVLLFFRQHYELRPPRGVGLGLLLGVTGFIIWVAPGHIFRATDMSAGWWTRLGFMDRPDGFNPSFIRQHSQVWYVVAVGLRFVRMVVVAALVEEILWRSFLMRFFADPHGDYWKVPFGTHHWRSFLAVTGLVVLVHQPVDYVPAAIFGTLMYWLAIRTKSLSACVTMHGTTNLLLGIYTLATSQWGYW